MNTFQSANNNINQINNSNRSTNLMLSQYNPNNSMMNQMTNYNQDSQILNQMNTFNPNNSMMDQMTNYNQDNQMLNQMNNFNSNNSKLDQITNYNNDNPLLNQMNTFNPNNQNLSQMNTFNESNPMLNQMTNFNQGNPILNQMNTMLNQMNNMQNQINTILNHMSTILNQMNSYDQSNPMLNMDIILINQMMNEINEKMKQMNQNVSRMNEINQEKRKKETIQNIDLNNLNQNQMELIISIIKFYKENGNEYMDFDNPYQIRNMIYFLSLNYHKLDISNNIEDPLYYIEEPKKMIKFINSDYKEYKVNIPLSITKYDLYSVAQNYKCFKNNNTSNNHSNILLINNNSILNRDETSIDSINENDIIIIIEPRNFPDDSYYNSLQERTEKKGNICFVFSSGWRIVKIFPSDIKIYEIYKSINLEFGLDINTYYLLSNGEKLKINDQKEGCFSFNKDFYFIAYETLYRILFGKIVMAKIIYNNKSEESEPIGILNSIKDLEGIAQKTLVNKKIIKFKIETKVIEQGDIRSLFSLGIKNNFTCFIEHEE